MGALDALSIPIWGSQLRVTFSILDNTGAVITSLTGLSSSISKDQGTAAAGGTPVEIATNSGGIYLDLTATEMQADTVWIRATATNANARSTILVIYPRRISLTRTGTAQAGAAGSITLDSGAAASDDAYNGSVVRITSGVGAGQARFGYDYSGSNKILSVMGNWTTIPTSSSVFEIGALTGAYPTGNIATVQNIVDGTWNELRSSHVTAGSFGDGIRIADGELNMKKGVAFPDFMIDMVLSADHITEATGKTVTAQRSVDKGAWTNITTQPGADIGFGTYPVSFSTTDLNGNCIKVRFTAPGCDPRKITIITQP
jgi:hypothetical protein